MAATYMNCCFSFGEKKDGDAILCGKPTDGYRYCKFHSFQVKKNNLCYDCLQVKTNPEFKLCLTCFKKQMAEKKQAAIDAGLCPKCMQVNENPSHKLCQTCFQKMNAERRQAAIDAGLCTNFYKCVNKVNIKGKMCDKCYQEFIAKKFHVELNDNCEIATAVTETLTDASFPKLANETKKKMIVPEVTMVLEKEMPKQQYTQKIVKQEIAMKKKKHTSPMKVAKQVDIQEEVVGDCDVVLMKRL